MHHYLYASRRKVSQLADQDPSFFAGVAVKLGFMFPLLSGEISGSSSRSTLAELDRLLPKLAAIYDMPSFEDIDQARSAPVYFAFRGRCAYTVDGNVCWYAIAASERSLLMAGSSSNVLGGKPVESEISPTANPLEAFRLAASGTLKKREAASPDDEDREDTDPVEDLSYVWSVVMGPHLSTGMLLPTVEGIGVFSALMPASEPTMRHIGKPSIRGMVIGTPLYVRQV